MRQSFSAAPEKSGCSRHRLYMAGTMSVCVMRSRSASCRKDLALNDAMTISVAAQRTTVSTSATRPVTWLIGTEMTLRSAGPMPMQIS